MYASVAQPAAPQAHVSGQRSTFSTLWQDRMPLFTSRDRLASRPARSRAVAVNAGARLWRWPRLAASPPSQRTLLAMLSLAPSEVGSSSSQATLGQERNNSKLPASHPLLQPFEYHSSISSMYHLPRSRCQQPHLGLAIAAEHGAVLTHLRLQPQPCVRAICLALRSRLGFCDRGLA